MRARGAPLRFLAAVALVWIGARVVLLWPQAGSLPGAIRALNPFAPVTATAGPAVPASPIPAPLRAASFPGHVPHAPREPAPASIPAPDPLAVQMALMG